MKKIFCVAALWLFFHARPASALTIHITFDSSVSSLTNAAEVETAFTTATQLFQDLFTNAATVNITMYWGAAGPFTNGIGLGTSEFSLTSKTYTAITNALGTHRTSAADTNSVASLPAIDPTNGKWFVNFAEAKVLGLIPANNSATDGQISFATNKVYTFDPNNRTVPGAFDFIGVAEHELSEILGRSTARLDPTFGYLPYDLFRFTNNAARNFDPAATNVYFSVDNGATALRYFYTNVLLGDIQDWKSTASPDACDAFVTSGHLLPFTAVDITAMDVLGYNGPGVPAAHLFAAKLANGNFQLRFVNTPGTSFTVFATTNLMLPLTSWTVLGTATEGPAGQFQFVDTTVAGAQRFYDVRAP